MKCNLYEEYSAQCNKMHNFKKRSMQQKVQNKKAKIPKDEKKS